jgi:hypothetical protein
MATTGLDRALLRLSDVTGDERYRRFIVDFRDLYEWNLPIVLGRHGQIEGHIYAYLAHALAQMEQYRGDPDARLTRPSRRVLEFLSAGDGLVVIGTCGDHECWHDTQAGTRNLGETCATAYLVRWLGDLLRLTGDASYGDWMERSIHNALFAAQSPDGSQIRYYTPMEGPRQYMGTLNWCCPGNFHRIIAELPQMIFYRAADGVAVNLYTPSRTEIDLPDGQRVTLRQETDYPSSGKVAVHVESITSDGQPAETPVEFTVRLRIPRWCPEADVRVGNQPIEVRPTPGTFVAIERPWRAGDVISLDLPMTPRWVRGFKANGGRVALMRGPLAFGLGRAANPSLGEIRLGEIVFDPDSLTGPVPDDSVRPGGQAFHIKAWPPGAWYPHSTPSLNLKLTEFPDPTGELLYLFVPNPGDKAFVDDQLTKQPPSLPR